MLWPSYWKTLNWCSQKLIMWLFLFSIEVHQRKLQWLISPTERGKEKKNTMYINTAIASGRPFQTLDSEFACSCNHLFLSIWGNRACQLLRELLYFHLNDISANSCCSVFSFFFVYHYLSMENKSQNEQFRKYFIFNCSLLSSNLQKVLQIQCHRKKKKIVSSLNE